jgi:hypothetical protein
MDSGGTHTSSSKRWYGYVTPRVIEILIKLIKFQLSPNATLNQDTKVWNQIQRQRFKTSSSV